MIRSTPPRMFAVNRHNGTSWPARPGAQVVRWVGPLEPSSGMQTNDEFRQYGALAPGDVPGLVQHLITDNATWSGSAISSWSDETGPDAVTINASPVEDTTSLPGFTVADFVPDDYVTTANFQSGSVKQMTIMAVARVEGSGTQVIAANDASGYSGDILFGSPVSTTWGIQYQDQNGSNANEFFDASETLASIQNEWHVWTGVVDINNESVRWYRDGVQQAEDTTTHWSTNVITQRAWVLGFRTSFSDMGFNGQLAEICWWEGVLTDGAIGSVTTYLQEKYGL